MTAPDRDRYVQLILDLYRATPGTRGRVRNADRRLAELLHGKGTDPEVVRAAFLLAVARRTLRSPDAKPLQPVASLHYFLPVIHEIQTTPIEPGYLEYLELRLQNLAPQLAKPIAHL